jgi:hypothetical protein
MRISNIALFASAATAFSLPNPSAITHLFARQNGGTQAGGRGGCPQIWSEISRDLSQMFLTADGQCNDNARKAIRLIFHDCGTWNIGQRGTGGCDGSIALNREELGRGENVGLADIAGRMKAMADQKKVKVADLIGKTSMLPC